MPSAVYRLRKPYFDVPKPQLLQILFLHMDNPAAARILCQTVPAAAQSVSRDQRQNFHTADFRFLIAAVPVRIFKTACHSYANIYVKGKHAYPAQTGRYADLSH